MGFLWYIWFNFLQFLATITIEQTEPLQTVYSIFYINLNHINRSVEKSDIINTLKRSQFSPRHLFAHYFAFFSVLLARILQLPTLQTFIIVQLGSHVVFCASRFCFFFHFYVYFQCFFTVFVSTQMIQTNIKLEPFPSKIGCIDVCS